MSAGTAEKRYRQLEGSRAPFLDRARDCAKLTIPTLLVERGTAKITTPFQGIGARGAQTLASKLSMALLPPNQPFFKLVIDDLVFDKEGNPQAKTDFDKALGKVEQAVHRDIEASADRVAINEAMLHLVVAGNVLLEVKPEGTRVWHLDRYVVKRDAMGTPLEIITHEQVSPAALPDGFLSIIRANGVKEDDLEKSVSIFTHIKRVKNQWRVYQEAFGEEISGTEGIYKIDECPWMALRFRRIDGEDYGRGLVEDYLGDLKSHETLTQAIVEASALAARVLVMVDPNGSTSIRKIAEAGNGDVITGNAAEVSVLQLDKYADLRVPYDVIQRLEERLSYAFLLNSAIQRNAERVTAEEIRYMAGELETALGGFYTIMSQEFQLPYVKRRLNLLTKSGRIPKLPKELVSPAIVTGVEALGRGNDRTKLLQFIQTITAFSPEVAAKYVNIAEVIKRLAIADGINTDSLIKTDQELAQEAQQAQMMQAMQALGPQAMQQGGGIIQQMMAAQQGAAPTQGAPNGQTGP